MNKGQLVDALESRLGSKRAAAEALEAVVDVITVTVAKGEKVAITGFGTFDGATTRKRLPADEGGRAERDEDQQINPDHSKSEATRANRRAALNIGTDAARLLPANGQRIKTGP